MSRVSIGGAFTLSASLFAFAAHGQDPNTAPVMALDAAIELPPVSVVASSPGSLTAPSVEQLRETIDLTVGSIGFIRPTIPSMAPTKMVFSRLSSNLDNVLECLKKNTCDIYRWIQLAT